MPAIPLATAVNISFFFFSWSLFLLHFTTTALQLISFEGVTAVRRSGCTNGQLISFSGLLPEANFRPLSLSCLDSLSL